MTEPLGCSTADELMNREFLEVRAKLLEVAAALDRVHRAAGSVDDDIRMSQIREAIATLQGPVTDSDDSLAQAIQLIFSLPYNETWQSDFGLS